MSSIWKLGKLANLKSAAANLPLSKCSLRTQWLLLLAVSLALAALLELLRLPASLLLGPMVAAIVMQSIGATIQVPKFPFLCAQAVIGCLIARAITPEILQTFSTKWWLFLSVVLSTVLVANALGWMYSKWKILPGTTAVWGLLPGAASVMMIMSEEFGADSRLVAFMQYSRVVCVALFASLISRFWLHTGGKLPPAVWFPNLEPVPFLTTLGLATIGVTLGPISKLPAGVMVLPMLIGTVIHATGAVDIQLPRWLLAVCYALLGWGVGLRFTPEVIANARRVLPQTLLSILALIAFSGAVGFLLVVTVKVDTLSAYLATSPGGMDSVAIIASSTKVDVSFVMALQAVRFFVVLLIGPLLSRAAARFLDKEKSPP